MATPIVPAARILCVEGDPDSCDVLRIILRRHDVSTAATMRQALGMAHRWRFNLYMLDGTFADGSGVDLCRQLRAFDYFTPILFFSGSSENSDIREAMRAGAQAYLIKPHDIDVLGHRVQQMLHGQGNRAERRQGFQPGGAI